MAIATSEAEARAIAEVEVQLKLRLERYFNPIIRRFLRDLSREYGDFYAETGQQLSTAQFNPELEAILRSFYRRVSNIFKSTIRDGDQEEILQEVINNQIRAHNDNRATAMAAEINQTNQNELNLAIARTLAAAQEEAVSLTNRETARVATRQFNSHVPGRGDTISITETQNISESAKNIEAESIFSAPEALAGLGLTAIASRGLDKLWVARMDSRTRPSHAAANGQRVRNSEVFTVGGEQLKYPGDSSLGASAGNVINCRCTAVLVPRLI